MPGKALKFTGVRSENSAQVALLAALADELSDVLMLRQQRQCVSVDDDWFVGGQNVAQLLGRALISAPARAGNPGIDAYLFAIHRVRLRNDRRQGCGDAVAGVHIADIDNRGTGRVHGSGGAQLTSARIRLATGGDTCNSGGVLVVSSTGFELSLRAKRCRKAPA